MDPPQQPVRSAAPEGVGVESAEQQPAASDAPRGAASDDRAHRISERVQTLRLEKSPEGARRLRGRWWLLLLLLLALGVAGTWAYRHGALRDLSGPIELESITITSAQPHHVVLDTTGNVVAPITVEITPQVSGTVVELNLKVQKEVRKGDLLLRIDDERYRAELEQAKATLAAANALLAEAQAGSRDEEVRQATAALDQGKARRDRLANDLRRAEELKDVIAPAEYDRAEASYREAEANVVRLTRALELVQLGPRPEQITALKAEVDKAQALVRKAQFFCDCTEIRSPIDGTVLDTSVQLGEIILIQPGIFATSIATIADLSRLEVEIDIQERDLAAVEVGQACLITPDAYPERQYRGRLDRLAPVLNLERGSRQATIALTDPDQYLATNMNCRVQVLKEERSGTRPAVPRVPQRAIVTEDGETFVFVLREGAARRRSVRLGTAEGGNVEVLEGLDHADEVLLPGDRTLRDGQPVRTRPRTEPNRW